MFFFFFFFWGGGVVLSHPESKQEELLASAHNAAVVQDVVHLVQRGGAQRSGLGVERLCVRTLTEGSRRGRDSHGGRREIVRDSEIER